MLALDYLTLAVAIGLVGIISIFVFGTLMRINPDLCGPGWWFAASLVMGLGFVAMLFRPYLGSMMLAINSMAAMLAPMLILEGILRFRGFGGAERRQYVLWLGVGIFAALSVLNRDDPVQRFRVHDAIDCLLMFAAAVALVWREKPGRARRIQGVAAFAFVLLALVFLRRCLLAWDAEPGTDLTQHPWMGVMFVVIFVQSVIWVETMNLTVNQRTQDRLHDLAMRDELTQLYNRRGFMEAMRAAYARAKRHGSRLGLLLIDLNEFKPINDKYGHEVGDAVLQAVGRRTENALRSGDLVGRIGGDEFLVLLDGCPSAEAATQAIERIRVTVEKPLQLGVRQEATVTLHPRISVGGVMYPDDADDMEQLLALADKRMYQDKGMAASRTV